MFTIWLITIWLVLDLLLITFSLPPMRDVIKSQGTEVWKRSINPISTRLDVVEQATKEIIAWIALTGFFLTLLSNLSEPILKALLEWCKGTLIVAFLPSFFSFVHDNNRRGQFWNTCCIVLGIIVSIVAYIQFPNVDIASFFMAIFVSTFVLAFYKMCSNGGKKVIIIGKGIRKDLYNRTSSIDLNMSKLEMIRKTEGFVGEYIKKYKKVSKLESLEYVTLLETHNEEWYARTQKGFLMFMFVTTLICFLESRFSLQMNTKICMVLVIIFVINIIILKCIDKEYLHRMAIRFCYSEWGYCLYYSNKCKFISNMPFFELSRNCKYIYTLLDYIAFIRVVYMEDGLNQTENIKMLSKNMALLYKDYDETEGKLWLKLLPLWIIAFLEDLLFGEIGLDTKEGLKKSVINEKEKVHIKLFLKSFVVDFFRRMPNEEDRKLVNEFMKKMIDFHNE